MLIRIILFLNISFILTLWKLIKKAYSFTGIRSAGLVIIFCFIIAVCIYQFLLGNRANFMNNDPNNHPLPGIF